MGINYNTKSIVNSDLVLCLDAANITSYNTKRIGAPINAQTLYATPGSYTFEVPVGITSISAVCIGGGGAGGASQTNEDGGAGGGGGMAWGTIAVTPLEDLTVIVGEGGDCPNGTSDGTAGGDSQLKRSSTILLNGEGGIGGEYPGGGEATGEGGSGGGSLGTDVMGGGNGGEGGNGAGGGGGGGGAAGYSGNGGDGKSFPGAGAGDDGAGGGGGGAGASGLDENSTQYGGGVGVLGEGANGEGGAAYEHGDPGSGGSGQTYGGGGGGAYRTWGGGSVGGEGADGAVRIVYKPNIGDRQYPTLANVADTTYNDISYSWNDITKSGNKGTLVNAPIHTSDNGGTFNFNGTNQYVDLGNIDSSNVLSLSNPAGGGLTISVAINWTQAGDDYPRIFNKADGSDGANGWTLYIDRTGSAVGNVRFRVNSSSYTLAASSNVTPATWEIWTLTHVKATDGAWVWYKNGISDNSGTQTYSIPTTTTTASIGRWHGDGKYFKGKIPFVNVYDRVLSAAEVKQNFDAQKSRFGL